MLLLCCNATSCNGAPIYMLLLSILCSHLYCCHACCVGEQEKGSLGMAVGRHMAMRKTAYRGRDCCNPFGPHVIRDHHIHTTLRDDLPLCDASYHALDSIYSHASAMRGALRCAMYAYVLCAAMLPFRLSRLMRESAPVHESTGASIKSCILHDSFIHSPATWSHSGTSCTSSRL